MRHHCPSLEELSARGNAGRQTQSFFAPCSPPCPDPVFPSTAEFAGGKTGDSSVGCYAAASSPSGSDVSKSQGIDIFATVIGG